MKANKTTSPKNEVSKPSIAYYQKEREILLALGNDLTKVRDKNDLIRLFKEGIKGLYFITHTIVTTIDYKDDTYSPFLLDNDGSPIRDHPRYAEMIKARFPLNEPFIQAVLNSTEPVSFVLSDIMDDPGSPKFLRVNYEKGVREILMAKLMREGRAIGFLHIYTDKINGFSQNFRDVIVGIIPQISSAVSNIIKNEELLKREKEKTFLLEFSSRMASVRTKQELTETVRDVLKQLSPTGSFVIRRICGDTKSFTEPYIYDFGTHPVPKNKVDWFQQLPLNDGLQNRILTSAIPLLFDVDREVQRGISSGYLHYWKSLGIAKFTGIRLRNGETNLGLLLLETAEINIPLLQSICAQISTAISNTLANEQLVKKQQEQSFLLDFSNDITQLRTKQDLQSAISRVLDKTLSTRLSMIRVIEADGIHLSPFMYDAALFAGAKSDFDKLANNLITVNELYTAQVLASKEGLVFNVEEEIKKGNDYARLWKTTGRRNMYGLPLRIGDKNIGTIWLLADQLNKMLIKGICSQISIAIDNIRANEQLLAYKKNLEIENDYLKEQIKTIYNFSEIIGSGEAMQHVYHLMSLVAGTATTILITGETGTGKELVARGIHISSDRKDKVMVKVNCAALPAHLIESELFGHEKGAFTGAVERRIGKFELAHQSTLFLDEIGELPLEAQSKLLRIIQERELERIGGQQTIKIDVRLIAATNRNLEEEVKAGRFRADLYFRLNVFPIHLPPLRERLEDLPQLTDFFMQKYSRNTGRKMKKIGSKVIQQLRSYSWPGNVRELEHLIERTILLTTTAEIDYVYLPKVHAESGQEELQYLNYSLDELERNYIIQVLKRCSGKISGPGSASEILQIPGNTLHSKMKKLNIRKSEYFT
ncbi:sigma-54-dependent Fis family transcriptional regulator [Sphingobacterium athyrii]|uniref:Fis family transcriptional regulator n=1 Tax=Sphingobacterium athyrii TaxID=2152717 RepID=A0A363P088_9SPHI|nr:sigma 54-interacting transcriptional regulator [Sphingobacterium athyrii]PUV26410.1 Fis family transcriptional regulator [Sphingobacterium athyrii]